MKFAASNHATIARIMSQACLRGLGPVAIQGACSSNSSVDKLDDFFVVAAGVELAHESSGMFPGDLQSIPIDRRERLCFPFGFAGWLLSGGGSFQACCCLKAKNTKMWPIDLLFPKQAFQLGTVLHFSAGASEDFFIEREDERVTRACRGDVKEPRHFLLHRHPGGAAHFFWKVVLGQRHQRLVRVRNFYYAGISRRWRNHVAAEKRQDDSLPFGTFRLLRGDQLDTVVGRTAHLALEEKIQMQFLGKIGKRSATRLRFSRDREKAVEFAFQTAEIFSRKRGESLSQLGFVRPKVSLPRKVDGPPFSGAFPPTNAAVKKRPQ